MSSCALNVDVLPLNTGFAKDQLCSRPRELRERNPEVSTDKYREGGNKTVNYLNISVILQVGNTSKSGEYGETKHPDAILWKLCHW